jgi:hypothetical protein
MSFEILQQIAVIARNLDNKFIFIQAESFNHHFNIVLAMFQPAIRIGRKIGISGMENVLCLFELFQLNQQAVFADINVQRIVRLHPVEVITGKIGIGKGRRTKG